MDVYIGGVNYLHLSSLSWKTINKTIIDINKEIIIEISIILITNIIFFNFLYNCYFFIHLSLTTLYLSSTTLYFSLTLFQFIVYPPHF